MFVACCALLVLVRVAVSFAMCLFWLFVFASHCISSVGRLLIGALLCLSFVAWALLVVWYVLIKVCSLLVACCMVSESVLVSCVALLA